jgi:phosphomannomutase
MISAQKTQSKNKTEDIFRAYDIRGKYPSQLDETTARKIGTAYAKFLNPKKIVLGRDMRISSPSLAEAFIKGVLESKVSLADIGMVTTPMLYFAIIDGGFDGGVMVTASHLPADINGFKLCREDAIPLSGTHGLPELEEMVTQMNQQEYAPSAGSYYQFSVRKRYIDKLSTFVHNPKPLKIAVDAGNGMVGDEVSALFKKFPQWNLIGMYMNPDGSFPNHVANPLIQENTTDLQNRVLEEKADIGVAFDGDADRCGFIDEKGKRIPADLVTALIAQSYLEKHPGSTILYDLRSSRVVPETIRSHGGKPLRCRVGHSFIKEQMRNSNGLFAGELSGHYYYRDMGFTDNAIFTMIWMLNFLASRDTPLSESVDPLRKYYPSGEINMQVDDKQKAFDAIEKSYTDAAIDHLDGLTVQYDSWWFNLRPSNTEPVIRLNMEANDEGTLKRKKDEILGLIRKTQPAMKILQ